MGDCSGCRGDGGGCGGGGGGGGCEPGDGTIGPARRLAQAVLGCDMRELPPLEVLLIKSCTLLIRKRSCSSGV